jgi:hypothetical protein
VQDDSWPTCEFLDPGLRAKPPVEYYQSVVSCVGRPREVDRASPVAARDVGQRLKSDLEEI